MENFPGIRIKRLDSFDDIVKKYHREIVNFQYRMVGNRFEAEDLAQDTFIKAFKKLGTLKDPAKVRGWLFQIARNTAVDFFRRNKEKAIALDNVILENFSKATAIDFREQVITDEIARELKSYINQLNSQDQTIIKLLYYEGFSYREIGEMLDMNENTLKSRLHRARKALYELIQANKALTNAALDLT